MAQWVNVGGTWKSISNMWVNVGGTWKKIVGAWVNVGGTWKQFFTAGTAPYNITAPTVVRNAASNYEYDINVGSWGGDTPITYTYNWYYGHYDSVLGSYTTTQFSPAKTGLSVTLSSSYIGYDIYCTVTATNAVGSTVYSPDPYLTVTAATSAYVEPGTPTNPVNSYFGHDANGYYYTCSWTAPATGTTPMSYYIQVWGESVYHSPTEVGSGGNYVTTLPAGSYSGADGGGFTIASGGSYYSPYTYNYFQVYAVNYDGTNYHSGYNSTSSYWA